MKAKTKHPLWRRWSQLRFQISNENSPQHEYYHDLPMVGFDDFWQFAEFVESEIGALPSPTHKLARKNQRAGYVRGNLYWAETHIDVGQRFVGIAKFRVGRRLLTFREMSEASGINENTIRNRIARGWTARDAMTIPPILGHKVYA